MWYDAIVPQLDRFSAFGGDRWTFAVARMEAGSWKTLDLRCGCQTHACVLVQLHCSTAPDRRLTTDSGRCAASRGIRVRFE